MIKSRKKMTQDEKWITKYNEVKTFIMINKRNPSRYDPMERGLYCNWLHHNRKQLNAGILKPERVEKLTIVDFRHDSTMIKRAYHCARCSESLENFWN
jgi:hypothetical protein